MNSLKNYNPWYRTNDGSRSLPSGDDNDTVKMYL